MFKEGAKIVYPMYGAGVIENVETEAVNGCEEMHYIIRIPNGNLKIKVGVSKAEVIGLRPVASESEISEALKKAVSSHAAIQSNWNVRYKENLEKIRTGNIAMDIIKPISFRKYIFSVAMGRNVYNFTFQFLPMLIVVTMLVQMYVEIQGIFHIMIFLVFLIGAILIRFLSGYMLGLLGFWYLTIWHLDRVLNDMISLFAGSFIPLWLFPKGLQAVAEWLPFKFIYYVPISAILGKIESGNYSILVAQMIGWIVILYLVGSLIWKFGHKHLMVQGG